MSKSYLPVKCYRLSIEDVLKIFESTFNGISAEEASRRLEKYGYNEVEIKKKKSPLLLFLKQFQNLLIYILLVSAIITAFLKHWIDTSVILGVVVINAIIGFIQEQKAIKALESLAKMMVPYAAVLRDGKKTLIPSREVVLGDVVVLEAGDRVPADLRLMYVKNLKIDESPLTGESIPVEKNIEPILRENVPLGDQRNMAFSGCLVVQGQGRGIVVAIGRDTEFGKISEYIQKAEEISTPLLRKIATSSKQLSLAIIFIAALTFGLGIFQGYGLVLAFLAAVSLAVAAIPEGLPVMLTITLAFGVREMAARNAIIRNLPAVETLGSTTVICTDKTGTLTKNQMTVVKAYAGGRTYEITGTGYEPKGEFLLDGRVKISPDRDLIETLKAGYLCNNAVLKSGSEYKIEGDPTEGALIVSAIKGGAALEIKRLDEIPFESEQQYMATLHEDGIIYVKGAPEKILSLCKWQLMDGKIVPLQQEEILEKAHEMASEALRVLAMAYKEVPKEKQQIERGDINDLIFLGLQGMIDPPREEAIEAVDKCKRAGIRVVMITGDHKKTALAIARKIGIPCESALSGEELEKISDDELFNIVKDVCIFARASPEHKLRIVKQLQRHGEIVAVTGDGINDAPALKSADIGIAMGLSGTEVAKEASDMVLTDDNFASIVAAVEEGRSVYNRLQKIILWTLPTNGGEALAVMAAIALAITLPLLPVQILWINMITAVALGLTLTVEPKEKGLLNKPPRPPNEPILTSLIKQRIVLVSLLMVIGTFTLFYLELENTGIDAARTIAVNTIVFFEIFYLLNSRAIEDSLFKVGVLSNKYALLGIAIVIALQLLITYVPFMNSWFSTAPISAKAWIEIIAISSSVFFIIELEKYIRRRLCRDSFNCF
jgi:magnesium-transporting ATPase (P-type)